MTIDRSVPLPVHVRRICPQILKGIVAACVRVEQMHDAIGVILYDPAAGFVAFDAEALFALGMESGVDFFRKGVDLPPAGAGGEDEEVVEGGNAPHVKYHNVPSLVVLSHTST